MSLVRAFRFAPQLLTCLLLSGIPSAAAFTLTPAAAPPVPAAPQGAAAPLGSGSLCGGTELTVALPEDVGTADEVEGIFFGHAKCLKAKGVTCF